MFLKILPRFHGLLMIGVKELKWIPIYAAGQERKSRQENSAELPGCPAARFLRITLIKLPGSSTIPGRKKICLYFELLGNLPAGILSGKCNKRTLSNWFLSILAGFGMTTTGWYKNTTQKSCRAAGMPVCQILKDPSAGHNQNRGIIKTLRLFSPYLSEYRPDDPNQEWFRKA